MLLSKNQVINMLDHYTSIKNSLEFYHTVDRFYNLFQFKNNEYSIHKKYQDDMLDCCMFFNTAKCYEIY